MKPDLVSPIEIALPMRPGSGNPRAFGMDYPVFEPFRAGSFVGDVGQGGPCNVLNMRFNPHGNGTHTECAGHIGVGREGNPGKNWGAGDCLTLDLALRSFWFPALLVTVSPEPKREGDPIQKWITRAMLEKACGSWLEESTLALVVRTLPNPADKCWRDYSGACPPAFEPAAMEWLCEQGVLHLCTDLPSVDPEHDEGALRAHRAFWQADQDEPKPRRTATITELIYADSRIPDGRYALNLMVPALVADAAPSRPVLYPLLQDQTP